MQVVTRRIETRTTEHSSVTSVSLSSGTLSPPEMRHRAPPERRTDRRKNERPGGGGRDRRRPPEERGDKRQLPPPPAVGEEQQLQLLHHQLRADKENQAGRPKQVPVPTYLPNSIFISVAYLGTFCRVRYLQGWFEFWSRSDY